MVAAFIQSDCVPAVDGACIKRNGDQYKQLYLMNTRDDCAPSWIKELENEL